MAEKTEKNGATIPALVDPHGVDIKFIDSIVSAGSMSGVANLVVGTRHVEPRVDGGQGRFVVVAARLRFTRHFVEQLRDSLDKMLRTPDTASEGDA